MTGLALPESAIRLADEITIGDLLRITDDEKNRKGILRIISYAKGHLSKKIGKEDEDRNLLLDLIELMNVIGEESFDKAFSKERARQEQKRKPSLPTVKRLRRMGSASASFQGGPRG